MSAAHLAEKFSRLCVAVARESHAAVCGTSTGQQRHISSSEMWESPTCVAAAASAYFGFPAECHQLAISLTLSCEDKKRKHNPYSIRV